jgi:hypothetical protein
LSEAADAEQSAVPNVTERNVGREEALEGRRRKHGPAERKPSEVVVTTRRERRALDSSSREERLGELLVALLLLRWSCDDDG